MRERSESEKAGKREEAHFAKIANGDVLLDHAVANFADLGRKGNLERGTAMKACRKEKRRPGNLADLSGARVRSEQLDCVVSELLWSARAVVISMTL